MRRGPSDYLKRRWDRQDRLFKQFYSKPEHDDAKAPADPNAEAEPSDSPSDGVDVPEVPVRKHAGLGEAGGEP